MSARPVSTMEKLICDKAQLYRERAVAWTCLAVVLGFAAYKFFRGLQCLGG